MLVKKKVSMWVFIGKHLLIFLKSLAGKWD